MPWQDVLAIVVAVAVAGPLVLWLGIMVFVGGGVVLVKIDEARARRVRRKATERFERESRDE